VEEGVWCSHSCILDHSIRPRFSIHSFPLPKPDTLLRATVTVNSDFIVCTGAGQIEDVTNNLRAPFLQYLAETEEVDWWFREAKIQNDDTDIVLAISNSSLKIVNDGSFKDGWGSAAVILEGDTPAGRASYSLTVPGDSGEMSAYRAELAGIYSAIWLSTKLCSYHNVSSGVVYFGCDGLSALWQSFSPFPPTIDAPSYDLLAAIHNARQICPVEWITLHIKGHQDD
jgi:hypothetical protein